MYSASSSGFISPYIVPLLSINQLDIQHGKKHLFKQVSAQVHENDRVGLVGVNGAGKSTLLKIMAEETESDPGVVSRASWFTVAYLPQEMGSVLSGRTLFQEAEAAFEEVLVCQRELDALGERLAVLSQDAPELEALLLKQGDLQQRLEGYDIFRLGADVEKILLR